MRLSKWHLSPTLISHNCYDEEEINTNWNHTSRFETPMVCYGCGEFVPRLIEDAFRLLLRYQGNHPKDLTVPFGVRAAFNVRAGKFQRA